MMNAYDADFIPDNNDTSSVIMSPSPSPSPPLPTITITATGFVIAHDATVPATTTREATMNEYSMDFSTIGDASLVIPHSSTAAPTSIIATSVINGNDYSADFSMMSHNDTNTTMTSVVGATSSSTTIQTKVPATTNINDGDYSADFSMISTQVHEDEFKPNKPNVLVGIPSTSIPSSLPPTPQPLPSPKVEIPELSTALALGRAQLERRRALDTDTKRLSHAQAPPLSDSDLVAGNLLLKQLKRAPSAKAAITTLTTSTTRQQDGSKSRDYASMDGMEQWALVRAQQRAGQVALTAYEPYTDEMRRIIRAPLAVMTNNATTTSSTDNAQQEDNDPLGLFQRYPHGTSTWNDAVAHQTKYDTSCPSSAHWLQLRHALDIADQAETTIHAGVELTTEDANLLRSVAAVFKAQNPLFAPIPR
jgi:hypothetical protein